MHPVNRVLAFIGLQLSRTETSKDRPVASGASPEFTARYRQALAELKRDPPPGFDVFEDVSAQEDGGHPLSYIDYECQFAAYHLNMLHPTNIVDIGSYRHFIIGLLSCYQVTTVDVRQRMPILKNEVTITCDAKHLSLPDNSFDAVTSLCTLEHLGLGRFGDDIDLEADKKGFLEMVRVLRPGGHLIFTTTITRARPSIAFNMHRIYSYDMLRKLCSQLECIEEKFYSFKVGDFCSFQMVTAEPKRWDIYCGCWKK